LTYKIEALVVLFSVEVLKVWPRLIYINIELSTFSFEEEEEKIVKSVLAQFICLWD